MAKYYGVETRYFDDGKLLVCRREFDGEQKPEDVYEETETYDLYVDWFGDKGKADKFYTEAMKEAYGV